MGLSSGKMEGFGMSDLFDWRTHLPVHPAADLFPLLSESELKELAEDIRKNGGLQQPVKLWRRWKTKDVVLLDGRNRLDALSLLGFLSADDDGELIISDPDGDDWDWPLFDEEIGQGDDEEARDLVISLNVHRRHLTAEQKRELIAELLKATPEQSNRTIAKQVKADDKTVGTVRRELEGRAEIPHVETRTDTKGRKQPSSKPERKPTADPVKLNGHAIKADDLIPAAQEQTPEELSAELAKTKAAIADMSAELAHVDDPDSTYDTAWQEASQEIEGLSAENKELRAEIERLKTSSPPEQSSNVVAIEPKAAPVADRTLADWKADLSVQMTEACSELPEQEKTELLEFLNATIEGLGLSGAALTAPLKGFQSDCDKWLPLMSDDERRKARIHISEWKPKRSKVAA
jgi:hypothetical protein